jgi:NADPH2:quinone reductase
VPAAKAVANAGYRLMVPLHYIHAAYVRSHFNAMEVGVQDGPRPDVLMRQGTYKWMLPLPAIPGKEVAGVVEALGPGVSAVAVGDRVLLSARELPQRGGGYAEYACAPAEALYPLPSSIGFDDAVSLPNFQLAQALLLGCGSAAPVRSVLITAAAGGVASAMLQTARAQGLQVIATASTADKRRYALSQGAAAALDPQAADLADQVKALTGGQGVDLALDPSGGTLFITCLHALAPLGLAVSYNILAGMPPDVFAVLRQLLGRSLAVRTFSMHSFDVDRVRRRALMQPAIDLMARGAVQAPPTTVMTLADARRAHELLDDSGFTGKLVLHP